MMSDHIVDRAIFRTLQSEPARGGLVLAVDYKLDTIFDMDDATKVKVAPHTQVLSSGLRPTVAIAQIGKEIPEFDAVDTGVFRVDPVLFEHLEAVFAVKGDTSLSDGVQALAKQGKARVADVGHAWWQDVDTPETRVYGDAMLRTASPERMVHLQQPLGYQDHLIEEVRKAKITMKEPSRG